MNKSIEYDAHVVERKVKTIARLPKRVLRELYVSICAQYCYARINPDQEVPIYEVDVIGEHFNWPQYTITLKVSRYSRPLAIVSITRDKSVV